MQPFPDLIDGLVAISLSPSILLTDYIALGGLGAAYLNSGLALLIMTLICRKVKADLNGCLIASLFMVVGFSFFGKNLINIGPLILGGFLYLRLHGYSASAYMGKICFSTGIAPLVSFVLFALPWPLSIRIPVSLLIGMVVGYITIPLSESMIHFHQGYNLYNVGFTLGGIGLAVAGAFRMFAISINPIRLVFEGNDQAIIRSLLIFCLVILVYGLVINRSFSGYARILKQTGHGGDFTKLADKGLILINMALLGLICLVFVKISQGTISGPVLGSIWSVIGFGANGKHPRNILPVLCGVFLASALNIYDPTGTEAIMISLFATTIAPVAGEFGFFVGLVAGFLHKAIATNVGFLHGGMNLYNNGLAGGLVAGIIVPIVKDWRLGKKILKGSENEEKLVISAFADESLADGLSSVERKG